jgi:hypothetical protein
MDSITFLTCTRSVSVWSCGGEFIRQLTDQVVASRSDRDGSRRLYVKLRHYQGARTGQGERDDWEECFIPL